jgi:lipoate-protein ligase A
MHHGCIMLDSDLERVSKALRVREAKFQSKNVKSVRSRVTTINAHASQRITMEAFKAALKQNILGDSDVRPYELKEEDLEAIERLRAQKYATWEWNYGKTLPGTLFCQGRFPWGGISLHFSLEKGCVAEAEVYSDAMDWQLGQQLRDALAGCVFSTKALTEAVQNANLPEEIRKDICTLLQQQEL